MKKKLNIELDITKIWAENGYLGFEYKTFVNNKLVKSGYYESDHVWNDSEMKQQLKNGYAFELALE